MCRTLEMKIAPRKCNFPLEVVPASNDNVGFVGQASDNDDNSALSSLNLSR